MSENCGTLFKDAVATVTVQYVLYHRGF